MSTSLLQRRHNLRFRFFRGNNKKKNTTKMIVEKEDDKKPKTLLPSTQQPPLPDAIILSEAQDGDGAASVIMLDEDHDCATTSTASGEDLRLKRRRRHHDWNQPYHCPSLIDPQYIMFVGLGVFILAWIWPPLILLFTYICCKLVPYSYRMNDNASTRRILYHEFCQNYNHTTATDNAKNSEQQPCRFRDIRNYVNLEENYWTNDRGMLLFTTIMTPKDPNDIKAVVCFCHGYTDHTSFAKRIEYQRLCENGIAFVGIEYEGHGRSDGALGLIHDWDLLIDDVSKFFTEILTTQPRFAKIPAFLMGESMGGAVAYCTYNRIPQQFRGVVFVCPMCKISDDMLPPQYVIDILKWLIGPSGTTTLLSYLPIAPSNSDLNDLFYKLPEKGQLHARCPLVYTRNPRLATARELISVTQRINETLHEFEAPFLVLHGLADRITDPKLSRLLYEEACSPDKSIRLYEGMWHALTTGEPDENIDRVFHDVIDWISARI